MSDNLLYALLTICMSLLIVLLYFCVKFMIMKEDIEYLEILLDGERWFHNSYQKLWMNAVQTAETRDKIIKSVSHDMHDHFELSICLYDYIWSTTADTTEELKTFRSGEMYKYLTEHNKLHTLHLIEGEHEKRIEKGNMYK